jgi:hypothetical protein
MSKKAHNPRRTLIEILRRAKRERDYLVAEIAENRRVMLKQSAFIREQQALIRKQDAALREMADGMREMKEMARAIVFSTSPAMSNVRTRRCNDGPTDADHRARRAAPECNDRRPQVTDA